MEKNIEETAELLAASFEHHGWTVLAYLDSEGMVHLLTSISRDRVADLLEHLAAHVRKGELEVIKVRAGPPAAPAVH